MFLFGIGYKGLDPVKSIRKIVSAFMIDEIVIHIGNHHVWLWICIELVHRSVFGIFTFQKAEICLLLKDLLDH